MVLVLDNTPYHHGRAPNYIDPLQLKREKLITELLLTAGQENMQVNRKGTIRSFNLNEALQQKLGGKNSPTVLELRKELQLYLSDHPELQRSLIQEKFEKEQHILIFTPPYTPVLQPIELTWSFVKNQVAHRHFFGRTPQQTKIQLLEAFYGRDPERALSSSDPPWEYRCYDNQMCLDHIKHSQKCCNEFIKDDETLSGTIHHLQEIRVEPNEQQVLAAEQQLAEEPVQCHDGTDLYFAGQEPFDEEEL